MNKFFSVQKISKPSKNQGVKITLFKDIQHCLILKPLFIHMYAYIYKYVHTCTDMKKAQSSSRFINEFREIESSNHFTICYACL